MLEGEQHEIAVLFCDIRGFTELSEALSPQDTVALLNTYYATMSDCVKRHYGAVNQFVGDEIFVTFGVPLAYPNNAENAVFCALEMMQRLEELNADFRARFEREIKIGIGVNYGEVVAGNLGSEDRIDYSVTGDTVNTGKRIEMLTRAKPNTVLISEGVQASTQGLFQTKAWEPVAVKGKREKLQVYEVLGRQ